LKSDHGFVDYRTYQAAGGTPWLRDNSNKEKKKPKAEWNKKKKSGPALSPFALAREQIQPGQNPFGKKN
jgi:hypothetical protein